jgi:hypothetical protein
LSQLRINLEAQVIDECPQYVYIRTREVISNLSTGQLHHESVPMPSKPDTELTIRCRPGALRNDELAAEISALLRELATPDTELSFAAAQKGLSAEEFDGAGVSVDQPAKGFGPDVVIIITLVAPSINHALKSAWDEVILPAIKSRLGSDAVGKEVEGGSEQDQIEAR